MFARVVISQRLGRQGKGAKKNDRLVRETGVLKEVCLNQPNVLRQDAQNKISAKSQTGQGVQQFSQRPSVKITKPVAQNKISARSQTGQGVQQFSQRPSVKITKPVAKKITTEKDVLPKNLVSISEDAEMKEDCIEETFDTLYANDIHGYLKSIESKCCPGPDFLDKEITSTHRRVLVAWMREVQEFLNLHQETFQLAVTITDLIVDETSVKLEEYQLLGLVGFLIAAKYLERYVPQIDTLVFLASYAYDKRSIIAKEKEVLRILDYDLNLPTSSWFLDYYTKDDSCEQKVQTTAALLLDLFALDPQSVSGIPLSMRAASSLMISKHLFARPKEYWLPDLESKSGYSSISLEPANRKLKELITGVYSKKRSSLEEKIMSVLPFTV